jgi:hypothetical protein
LDATAVKEKTTQVEISNSYGGIVGMYNNEDDVFPVEYMEKICKRIDKYRARGYHLELIDKCIYVSLNDTIGNERWLRNVSIWNHFWETRN